MMVERKAEGWDPLDALLDSLTISNASLWMSRYMMWNTLNQTF